MYVLSTIFCIYFF